MQNCTATEDTGTKLVPIEVKLSSTPSRGMARGLEDFRRDFGKRSAKGYVVHPGEVRPPWAPTRRRGRLRSCSEGSLPFPFFEGGPLERQIPSLDVDCRTHARQSAAASVRLFAWSLR